jgi:hypothetical protein
LEGAERDAVIDHAQLQIQRVIDAVPDLGIQNDGPVPEPVDLEVDPG